MLFLKNDIYKSSDEINNEHLKKLLSKQEPRLVRFYARLWKTQSNVITYQEIRKMILTGEIDSCIMERWYKDYSEFVKTYLVPEWKVMVEEAGNHLGKRFSGFEFNPNNAEITNLIYERSAELITNSASYQIEAIKAMVQRAAVLQDITVDELAYVIRPVIGLYQGQSVANLNYYQFVRNSLLENNPTMREATAQKRAKAAAVKYAEKQHRYRAQMIARSELAFAYNTGEYGAVKQAQAQSLIGRLRKQWITADDDRVCERCKALDMTETDMEEEFPGAGRIPPLHPQCRCVVNYIECEDNTEKGDLIGYGNLQI